MNAGIGISKKKEGYIRNSLLIPLAFATAFFPRILYSFGFPSFINFAHFLIVPLACSIVIIKTKIRDKKQISISQTLLAALFTILGFMTASALINHAGVINIFLLWMLLCEPFLLLLAIICISISPENLKRIRTWILGFGFVHLFLAFLQYFLLSIGRPLHARIVIAGPDSIQGVFFVSGSGHVVGVSVSMAFGLYYFVSAKTAPMWLRVSVFFAAFYHLLIADAKQVLLVWLIGWLFLIFLKFKDIKATIQYLIAAILITYGLYWCLENLEIFSAFKVWIRPELYGPDGLATQLKTAPLRIIPSFYKSPLNWLFGLGPGHTVGRLGGWMLKDYSSLLNPLGATIHPASQAVWEAWGELSWLDSSFFAPFWGWAGIWGDLGFLGLGAYLYLASIVWRRLCLDDYSKFQMLTVMIFGFIFTQMEEPGYMLCIACLIGLRWHEQQIAKRSRFHSPHLVVDPDPQLNTN